MDGLISRGGLKPGGLISGILRYMKLNSFTTTFKSFYFVIVLGTLNFNLKKINLKAINLYFSPVFHISKVSIKSVKSIKSVLKIEKSIISTTHNFFLHLFSTISNKINDFSIDYQLVTPGVLGKTLRFI